MKLNATGYYILVEMEEVESISDGGIVMFTSKEHEREQGGHDVGIVRDIGPTAFCGYAGIDTELPVIERAKAYGLSVGDKVEFNRYDGKTPRHPEYGNFRIIQDQHLIGRYKDE